MIFAEGDVSLVAQALATHPVAASLATVELASAIEYRAHAGFLDNVARLAARGGADRLLARCTLIPLSEEIARDAVTAAEGRPIRSLDAIHVGTVMTLARQQGPHGNLVRFCTADRRQAEVAEALLGAGRVDFVPPWR